MIIVDIKEKKVQLVGTKIVLLDEFANIVFNLFEMLGTDDVVDAVCCAHDRYIDTHDTDDDFIL